MDSVVGKETRFGGGCNLHTVGLCSTPALETVCKKRMGWFAIGPPECCHMIKVEEKYKWLFSVQL